MSEPETTPTIMPPTVDEFFALPMQAQAKLVAVWLLTRPAKTFNFREIASALHMHAWEVEQCGLYLMRGDATPFHPIARGIPSEFEIPAEHILRETFDSGEDDDDDFNDREDIDPESTGFVADGGPYPTDKGAKASADQNTHQPARRRRRKGRNRNV